MGAAAARTPPEPYRMLWSGKAYGPEEIEAARKAKQQYAKAA